MAIDRKLFFDMIRENPFPGTLSQSQVDGVTQIIKAWARHFRDKDTRWLAYCSATTLHETASTMEPIEEYYGSAQPYGQVDPETGQAYWGRGFVQLHIVATTLVLMSSFPSSMKTPVNGMRRML